MLKTQPILRFLLGFILAYAGLLIIFSFAEHQFAAHYQAMGKAAFEKFGNKGIVQFSSRADNDSNYKLTTKIILFNRDQVIAARQSGQASVLGAELYLSSWYNGVLPMVLLISLILASPVPWKRKLIAILVGLLVIYLFILLKMHLAIANEYLNTPSLGILPSHSKLVKTTYEMLVANIETTFIIPVFIWILVTFRKKDLQRLRL